MPTATNHRVVSISIDTEAASNHSKPATEAMDSVVVELFDRFQKQRLPATWIFGDPKRTSLAERIARTGDHELALNCNRPSNANIGPIRQLLDCQGAGFAITTVAENSSWRQHELDLLAKHGITVVRGSASNSGTRRVQSVRYGVWRIPTTATLHGGGWVPYFAQVQRSKRSINQVIGQIGVCHVCIDAPSIARSDVASGLRAVERLLAYLNHLQATRCAAVATLRETAVQLQPRRASAAARSILRAA